MHPLLAAVADGETHQFREVIDTVREHFQLTPEEAQEKIASGKQTIIKNRISWARTYLTKAGLLESPGRGLTRITPRGREALAQTEAPVRVKYLKQFPEFKEFHAAKSKPNVRIASESLNRGLEDNQATPEERLEEAHEELNRALGDELLDTIKSSSPEFFEQLVVDLMLAMGYGGSRKEAGRATQYSHDGGIDGVINEDPLGLEQIYLQAKRYTDHNVQRPEIDTFIGALTRNGARKGVFITTSSFSSGAIEAVQGLNISVVLIDGSRLAELMLYHSLGVSVKETYQVKAIDTDYFNED
ncbi:restriction endonuclease [Pseudoteredinibacter isoporae]